MRPDRRKFIRQTLSAALGGASVYSALGNLQLLQAATRATNYAFGDYKALVCVFLYGGNDGFNTVVPYTQSQFQQFLRLPAACGRNWRSITPQLHRAAPMRRGSSGDGIQYALHRADAGTGDAVQSGQQSARDHGQRRHPGAADHAVRLQAPSGACRRNCFRMRIRPRTGNRRRRRNTPTTGWGGRICDMVASANPANIPIMTSLSGQDAFIRGQQVNGYIMNASIPLTVDLPSISRHVGRLQRVASVGHPGKRAGANLCRNDESRHRYRRHHQRRTQCCGSADVQRCRRAISKRKRLQFRRQLQTVAQIDLGCCPTTYQATAGCKRQVFFVNAGGYDTHSDEINQHVSLLPVLSRALNGFYQALNSVGLAHASRRRRSPHPILAAR